MTNSHAPQGSLPRIDPRRPFTITADGLIRITLGAVHTAGQGAAVVARPSGHAAPAKPRRTTAPPQHSVLVAAFADRGTLADAACQAIAGAALLADVQTEVVLVVFGACQDDGAAWGADKVVVFDDVGGQRFAPDSVLQRLSACVAQFAPERLFFPDVQGAEGDLGRRFAASTGMSVAAHVVEIDRHHVAILADAKRAYATRNLPQIVLLATNAVDPNVPFVGAGVVVDAGGLLSAAGVPSPSSSLPTLHATSPRYRDLGIDAIDAAQLPLEEADRIVAAGNGVQDVAAVERLAVAFGAAVGASRVAVDDGRFPRDKQIGATGKTVDASVYIAFGISGAVQHLQGIKSCRHVIAVNTDASAPIAKRADLLVVEEADVLLAALADVMTAARDGQGQGQGRGQGDASVRQSGIAPSVPTPDGRAPASGATQGASAELREGVTA